MKSVSTATHLPTVVVCHLAWKFRCPSSVDGTTPLKRLAAQVSQPQVSTVFFIVGDKAHADHRITDWIGNYSRPFPVIHRESFEELVGTLRSSYQLPTVKMVRKQIIACWETEKNRVRADWKRTLLKIDAESLLTCGHQLSSVNTWLSGCTVMTTTDRWSRSYIDILAFFIRTLVTDWPLVWSGWCTTGTLPFCPAFGQLLPTMLRSIQSCSLKPMRLCKRRLTIRLLLFYVKPQILHLCRTFRVWRLPMRWSRCPVRRAHCTRALRKDVYGVLLPTSRVEGLKTWSSGLIFLPSFWGPSQMPARARRSQLKRRS